MIDLAQIMERIEKRLGELGKTAAEVSAQATDSKDTIRNWARAVEADRKNGTNKASATTIKLNQIESALGIELARNSSETAATPEGQLRAALLAFGVDASQLTRVTEIVRTFVDEPEARSAQSPSDDQSQLASRRRVKAP